jgi:hypothetical protein
MDGVDGKEHSRQETGGLFQKHVTHSVTTEKERKKNNNLLPKYFDSDGHFP